MTPQTRQRFETLQESLTKLENTDPAVAAAAQRLDQLPDQLEAMHRARAFADRIRDKRERAE